MNDAKADSKSSEVKPELVVSAMVALFVFGLLAIAILLGVMKEAGGFELPFLLLFTTASFVIMLMVEGVFISLLLRRKKGKTVADFESATLSTTKELQGSARKLPEPLPSVTEHTTRAFEPVYSEREAKDER